MQVDALKAAYVRQGRFVSLHMEVSRSTEDGRQLVGTRRKNAGQELARKGVTKTTLRS
jgi:hypothetical protein